MRVAAIDVGSNSIRLLVADVGSGPEGTLATIARAGEPCRLARGLDTSGRIAPEIATRAGEVVAEFARRARSLGARHLVVGATAALRAASNGAEVSAQLEARAGVPVRILAGEIEARLVYQSVVFGLAGRVRSQQCVVFDLGGGSTEIVSGVGGQAGRWVSLPVGAVVLAERFGLSAEPHPERIEAARAWVREQIMHGCASLPQRTSFLAGVGGTVTVLASLDRGLGEYDPGLLEGWVVDRARLSELLARIVGSTPEERRRLPVMGEGRADIVGAGALAVEAMIERFDPPGLVCSTQGLRYGLVRLAAEEATRGSGNGVAPGSGD
jgi:exopolyphosphatase/guanosine-5'-triphosphate,3'-diphosphate pyrophosphatase